MKILKKMSIETFDEHGDSGLYAVEYHLFDQMVEDIRKFVTVSVLDSSQYEQFNEHIKHSVIRRLRRKLAQMTETINTM